MPLLPGVENIGHNIKEMQAHGHKYSQALAASLRTAYGPKHKAFGGGMNMPPWWIRNEARQMNAQPSSGALLSSIPGRTDHIPLKLPKGSYVVPADVVSGLGQGNTNAGHSVLDRMFKTGPFGMSAPLKNARPVMPHMPMPKPPRAAGLGNMDIRPGKLGFADGGEAPGEVPVMAAGGEHVLYPEQVEAVGGGNINNGYQILDEFVKHVRQNTIDGLKKLPGPKRD